MRVKVSKENFIIILSGGVIFLAAFLFSLSNFIFSLKSLKQSRYTMLKKEYISSTEKKHKSINFNEETRIYTSPRILGSGMQRKVITFTLPESWTIENENTKGTVFLEFAKQDSKLVIGDVFEEFSCVFPEYSEWGEFGYAELDHFGYITTNFGEYRVGKSSGGFGNTINFYLCDDSNYGDQYTDSPWLTGTKIGHVRYSVGFDIVEGYDQEKVDEIVHIIENISILETGD